MKERVKKRSGKRRSKVLRNVAQSSGITRDAARRSACVLCSRTWFEVARVAQEYTLF